MSMGGTHKTAVADRRDDSFCSKCVERGEALQARVMQLTAQLVDARATLINLQSDERTPIDVQLAKAAGRITDTLGNQG